MHRWVTLLVVCAFPVVFVTAAQEDMVANPPFKNWSAFKKGTTVKLLQTVTDKSSDVSGVVDATARPDAPAETYITYRLIELTPEKAVVTMTQTEIEEGSEVEHAPTRITYRAMIHKKHTSHALPKSKVENFKEGDEELDIAGKKIKTHWVETSFKAGDEASHQKVWYSDDVPGGTVKSMTTKKEGGKVIFETTLTLVSLTTGD